MTIRPEKYICICSYSQAALKALQAVKTTFPLVWQCQRALGALSSLFGETHLGFRTFWWRRKWNRRWVLGRVLLTNLQDLSQPTPGIARRNIRQKIKSCYLSNTRRCPSLTGNQRQAQELILGPSFATKTRLLSHNRTQYRVIKGLLIRHNTITRHLYMKRLPWCRKCGAEEEISAHVLWRCEALATLRYHLGFLFLDSKDVRNLSVRAHWEL